MTANLTKPIRAIHFLVLAFMMMLSSPIQAQDFEENSLAGNRPMIRPKELSSKVGGTSVQPQETINKIQKDPVADALAAALAKGAKPKLQPKPQVEPCFTGLTMPMPMPAPIITLELELSPAGKPLKNTIRLVNFDTGTKENAQQAFEVAKRAILECGSLGFKLPAERYSEWRFLQITFNSAKMK